MYDELRSEPGCDALPVDCEAVCGRGAKTSSQQLNRNVFRTSRLLEFCSVKELTLQTGHSVDQWPLAIAKELLDNSLDACEGAQIAPKLAVTVQTSESQSISVSDQGPGIAPETVTAMLDFSVRASSNEAYASPTRGAQGNALKTLIAMPFALDGEEGATIIEARGVRHSIKFSVDRIRQVPKLEHVTEASDVKNGTSVTIRWPQSACSDLVSAKPRFLQITEDYAWLNPHLSVAMDWDGEQKEIRATDPTWRKWLPCDPIPAHWYDYERFERLIAAYLADDQDRQRTRTVREFIAEFRGMSGSAKQKEVLDATGTARMALANLFADGKPDKAKIVELLSAIQRATKAVKPQDLGLIGKEHLAARLAAAGVDLRTFNYKRMLRDDAGLPTVIEVAFGYCPNPNARPIRRLIAGVNWSVGINNPFRQLGQEGQSLDSSLEMQRVGRLEPVIVLVHLASPRITYTDRGKSALALGGAITSIEDQEDDEEFDQ
jgi:DNA topoisomerase VI subunit B